MDYIGWHGDGKDMPPEVADDLVMTRDAEALADGTFEPVINPDGHLCEQWME